MRSAQSQLEVGHAARAAREHVQPPPRVTNRSAHRTASAPRPGRTKSGRCEAARPTDRQRAAGRKGIGLAAAGPRTTQSHRRVQRNGTRDADPLGQLPGAKRLSSQSEAPGETSSFRQVQRTGRRSRLSPAGKAKPTAKTAGQVPQGAQRRRHQAGGPRNGPGPAAPRSSRRPALRATSSPAALRPRGQRKGSG